MRPPTRYAPIFQGSTPSNLVRAMKKLNETSHTSFSYALKTILGHNMHRSPLSRSLRSFTAVRQPLTSPAARGGCWTRILRNPRLESLAPCSRRAFSLSPKLDATHRDNTGGGRTRSSRSTLGNLLDNLPNGIVFWSIIGANGVVFLLWQTAEGRYVRRRFHEVLDAQTNSTPFLLQRTDRDPSWFRFMTRNFTASFSSIREGRL
jgi:hypothetical protein